MKYPKEQVTHGALLVFITAPYFWMADNNCETLKATYKKEYRKI